MNVPTKAVLAAGLFVSLGLGMTAISRAEDNRNFWVINNSDEQVDNVFVSRHSAQDWGEDVMGKDDVLEANSKVKIVFDGVGTSCHYDVQVVYHDGHKKEVDDVNLCETDSVTFSH